MIALRRASAPHRAIALHRAHRLIAAAWTVVAGGAALGFLARDLLGLPPPAVALAWVGGGLAGVALARGGRQRPPGTPRPPPV